MSQSLCQIYIHIIFHTKTTSPLMKTEDMSRMHAYLATTLSQLNSKPEIIGGVENHVHILTTLPKTESVAHIVEDLKRRSSRWFKTLSSDYAAFSWQRGYAAFSVSQSQLEKAKQYISNQPEHHRTVDYRTEYTNFLKLYHLPFDETTVLDD